MANELYEILGVSPTATDREIKVAYFGLARTHTPEKEPEKFKAIRSAYETLRDPKARANYDSLQSHGEKIRRLEAEASQYMNSEDWGLATNALQGMLELAPNLDWARNSLGLCYAYLEEWDQSEKVFQELTDRTSDVPVYWSNYGFVLREKAKMRNDNRYSQQARSLFHKAKDLEPRNSDHYVEIAKCYLFEDRFELALQWLDRAIHADEEVGMDDLDAFVFKCITHLQAGDLQRISEVATEIENIDGATSDFFDYASRRLASIGLDLFRKHFFTEALVFLEAARILESNNADLKELYDACLLPANCQQEWEELKDDEQVIPPLARLAALGFANLVDEVGDVEEVFQHILLETITKYRGVQIEDSLRHLRSHYPWTAKLNLKAWNLMWELAAVWKQYNTVENNSQIIPPVKALCFHTIIGYYGFPETEGRGKEILNALESYPMHSVYSSVLKIRSTYNLIYDVNNGLFDELINISNPYSAKTAAASGSGCMLPTMMFVLCLTAIVSLLS